jgi:hypothetical protein
MRNCKTPKKEAIQSEDYATIHVEKRDISQYPLASCTPPYRGRGPPNDEAATICGEFQCTDRSPARENNFYH